MNEEQLDVLNTVQDVLKGLVAQGQGLTRQQ
jgi:hypothetical protein